MANDRDTQPTYGKCANQLDIKTVNDADDDDDRMTQQQIKFAI